ncbi:Diadenosine tetraphosphate (Ap4A) hydrolase [Oceanospirillum multiglobuliferum]|uniref:HIT domain-containing protein n=1 Tax=Oceanospirillum multiglobuliferum TaxID=64969 RepID=A0A1T4QV99_9GAMM|nr:HIT family protein [Oceanospirillum multiglobuliferum]OPX57102.1 hypothetical protein BTE48_01355 [Oceanospirillum multiglobuliferum]SKA07710.1 Diadenosine tetraphosphate (Ap4A) hydrolase [Oceanospirillum multiglobuliferum]
MFTLHSRLEQDTIPVADLGVSRLCMMNDARYPWFILIPRVGGITELYELEQEVLVQVMKESCALAEAMMQAFHGQKMNVAALGNIVPQLHIHHVVRAEGDAAWPAPVWGVGQTEPMGTAQARARIQVLLPELITRLPDLAVA